MTPTAREQLLAAGRAAAARQAADLDAALADGSGRYRRRVVRTYAAAALAVVLVGAGALGAGVASRTTTPAPMPDSTTAAPNSPSLAPSSPTRTRTSGPAFVTPTTATPPSPPTLAMTERVLRVDKGRAAEAHVVDWSSGRPTPVQGSDLVWTSTDESVASVSDAGIVTGVSEGTTTVTASMGGSVATVTIEVNTRIQ